MTREGIARLAFEAHHDAEHGADGDGDGDGWDGWTRLTEPERVPWLAVGALIESCVDGAVTGAQEPEDAPGAQAAKIMLVERDGHPARLFAATRWDVLTTGPEAGDLLLQGGGDEWVAQIGARHWDSVCDAEAILPADLYGRHGEKLAIALDALRQLADEDHDPDNPGGQAFEIAGDALARIAELDQ